MSSDAESRDFQAMQIAYLVSLRWKQEDICSKLSIKTQSEVSRLLDYAEKRGWIQRWHLSLPDDAGEQVKGSVFMGLDELKKKLTKMARSNRGVAPTEVHVVYRATEDQSREYNDYAERTLHRVFGRGAASIVEKLLAHEKTRVCAVAWGNTIKGLIDAMPRQPKPRKGLTFVPVSGEPFNVANVDFSPTRAARRLAEAFQAEPNNTCSLAGIAARIPKELDQHSAIIKLFLNSSNDYKRIFGDSNPLCEQLDVIITGIGDVATSRDDPWFQETKELEGQEDLAKIAAGNIGGIWIPKESATKTERNQLHDLNRRWLGVREEDYRKCAERAEAGECPGVVVVAIEKEKAGIVAKAMGLINHVIIDRGLAEALLQYN